MNLRRAVVLLGFGGPRSQEEILPFLYRLFSDPFVFRYPWFFRLPLAFILSRRRAEPARESYGHLGGKSPFVENTKAQAQALERLLGKDYKVFIALRYSSPTTEQAAKDLKDWDPHEVTLLPLYPHFSQATTFSSFKAWERAMSRLNTKMPQNYICCYPENHGFIHSFADIIEERLKSNREKPLRILFSAHGLPMSFVNKGDPYVDHIELSAKKIIEQLENRGYPHIDWQVCYQSRVGPLRWTEPYLADALKKAAQDKKGVLVVPVSFTCEHSETLVELDIEYKEKSKDLGVPFYIRVPAVGTHPSFIQGLAQEILHRRPEKFYCDPSKKCWCMNP